MSISALTRIAPARDLFALMQQGYHLKAEQDGQTLICQRDSLNSQHELRARLAESGQWQVAACETSRADGTARHFEGKGATLAEAVVHADHQFADRNVLQQPLTARTAQTMQLALGSAWGALRDTVGKTAGWAKAAEGSYEQACEAILERQGWKPHLRMPDGNRIELTRPLANGASQVLAIRKQQTEAGETRYSATLETRNRQGTKAPTETRESRHLLPLVKACVRVAAERGTALEQSEQRLAHQLRDIVARCRSREALYLSVSNPAKDGIALVEVKEAGHPDPLAAYRMRVDGQVDRFASALGRFAGTEAIRIRHEPLADKSIGQRATAGVRTRLAPAAPDLTR